MMLSDDEFLCRDVGDPLAAFEDSSEEIDAIGQGSALCGTEIPW